MATNNTIFAANSSGQLFNDSTAVGWVESSEYRGTVDILWSCCITIVLCVWVSTHPNVPSPEDRWYHRQLDKLNMACIGLVGPDFLFAIALGQLASARRSVKRFQALPESIREKREWTLTHGFFGDMGGFILKSPDFPQGFPIRNEHLFYLVEHGHLDFPNVSLKDIKDMNSVDSLSKAIVVWQVMWFTVTEIDRIAHGYPLTTLELTALSFSLMMVATSASWYFKPSISRGITIETKNGRTVEEIRAIARSTTHPDLPYTWYKTPLYFLSQKFDMQTHWRYHVNTGHYILRWSFFSRPVATTPWDRFPSDIWFAATGWRMLLFGTIIQLPFSMSFLSAWWFHFPTDIEMWLWRACSIFHFIFSCGGGIYYIFLTISFSEKSHEFDKEVDSDASTICEEKERQQQPRGNMRGRVKKWIHGFRNLSPDQDPDETVSLRFELPLIGVSILYAVCRAYFYLDDFIGLRDQPAGVYRDVSKYLPFQ
ncbi:hypothetical protein B0H66DRAFT_517213 [Apodospora peruviana]|uniref:Uncharacterized protein n=1 Tax=Apodospora peruviana TaxID=516989 RepID=A0AAE0I638_9PEZI|nr:hypothetical protein B0H66DRAFT_517213 [Apodospora peruviana]